MYYMAEVARLIQRLDTRIMSKIIYAPSICKTPYLQSLWSNASDAPRVEILSTISKYFQSGLSSS